MEMANGGDGDDDSGTKAMEKGRSNSALANRGTCVFILTAWSTPDKAQTDTQISPK